MLSLQDLKKYYRYERKCKIFSQYKDVEIIRICVNRISNRFKLHNFSFYDIMYDDTSCFDLFALQLPGLGGAARNRSENR